MEILSEAAKRALINADPATGRLPQGTPETLIAFLRDAGWVAKTGLTVRGRSVRRQLIGEAL